MYCPRWFSWNSIRARRPLARWAAWRTAVEAAPWLVGESEPHEEVPPEELYEKLRPFKDKVAEDIKDVES